MSAIQVVFHPATEKPPPLAHALIEKHEGGLCLGFFTNGNRSSSIILNNQNAYDLGCALAKAAGI